MLRAPAFPLNQPLRMGVSFTTTIYSFYENGLHLLFIIIISLYRPRWGGLVLEGVTICTKLFIKILY